MSKRSDLFKSKRVWLAFLMLVSQNSSALPGWMVGVYQGFDPIAAQRGLDLDRSRLDLIVTASSIVISSAPDVVGRQWKYKYSEAWIDQNSDFVRAHNNLMRTCLGLKGVAGGRHLLCFNRLQLSTDSAEVTLHPTENPTVQTGAFFRKRKQLIESTYWSLRNAKVPFSGDSWDPYHYQIPEFDFEHADEIMASGDRRQKNELIKKIGNHLWARGSKEIKVLVKYLNLAIHDPDPVVQVFALDVFTEPHPIVQGVPLVLGVLNNPDVFPHTTVQRAASAGLSLLLQGQVVLKAKSTLESLYGTSDLDDLYKKTEGIVSAEARGAIETILRLPEQGNSWDAVDRTRLLSALLKDREAAKGSYFFGLLSDRVRSYLEARANFENEMGHTTPEQRKEQEFEESKRKVIEAFVAIRDAGERVRQWRQEDLKELYSALRAAAERPGLDRSIGDTIRSSPLMKSCAEQLMGPK